MRFLIAIALVALLAVACTTDRPTPGHPASTPVQQLEVPRAVHRATTLPDGRVLLTGGCTAAGCTDADLGRRTELFDPDTGRIRSGPALHRPRLSHTATLLPDGRVLVAGGYPGEGAAPIGAMEVVDLSRGTVTPAGSLNVPRADHTATLLADGRVLVAGGRGVDGGPLRSAEIVDLDGRLATPGPDLPAPRSAAIALRVGDHVLVTGGTSSTDRAVASTVLFDAATDRWRSGPAMRRARVKHAAVALPDGAVLIAGGAPDVESRQRFTDTEVLEPGGHRFRPGPALTDGRYKLSDAAAVLPDGRVVLGGGPTLDVVDLRDGTAHAVHVTGLTERLSFQSVSVLPQSRVLVAGGYDDAIVPSDVLRVVRIH